MPAPRRNWTEAEVSISGAIVLVLAIALGLSSAPLGGPPSPPPDLVVDPNAAPPGVLSALPRIGPVLAGRIVAAREESPFTSLDDLDARVRGIGPATREALRPHLRFPAGEPAPPNR